jgi:mercuric ion transport protein
MNNKKNTLLLSSVILAITSSLCCIVPLLTILGGISGLASSLGWVQPFRPYLIALTCIVLGIAFYQAYKPVKKDACGCDIKKSFFQSKTFLWSITLISALLMAFPYYSEVLFASKPNVQSGSSAVAETSFKVIGMTCESCEHHVNSVLLHQTGVFEAITNFEDSTTTVKFDQSKVSLSQLMNVVRSQTGYTTTP